MRLIGFILSLGLIATVSSHSAYSSTDKSNSLDASGAPQSLLETLAFDLEFCTASVTYWQALNQSDPQRVQAQTSALSERFSPTALQRYFDILQRVDRFILSLNTDQKAELKTKLQHNFLLSRAPERAKSEAIFEGFQAVIVRCDREFEPSQMTAQIDADGSATVASVNQRVTLRLFNEKGNYYLPDWQKLTPVAANATCGQLYERATHAAAKGEIGPNQPFAVTWFETDAFGTAMHTTLDYLLPPNLQQNGTAEPRYSITPVTLFGVVQGRVQELTLGNIDTPLDALVLPQGREQVGADYRANATLYQLDDKGWLMRDVWLEGTKISPGTQNSAILERWTRYDELVCSEPETIFSVTGRF